MTIVPARNIAFAGLPLPAALQGLNPQFLGLVEAQSVSFEGALESLRRQGGELGGNWLMQVGYRLDTASQKWVANGFAATV